MKKSLTLAVTMLLGSAPAVWAHPGHGFVGTVESAVHWLSSVDHALTLMALIVMGGAVVGRRAFRREKP